MPTFKSIELLAQLTTETNQFVQEVTHFQQLTNEQLTWKADEKTWSISECIEHLNNANFYYLKQFKKVFELNKIAAQPTFKSGFFGNMMVKNMQPIFQENQEVKIPMKMKTLPDFEPKKKELEAIFTTFFEQQTQFLSFLKQAENINLSKNRVHSAVGSILKFRLGDSFRFIVAHNQRHLIQAKNIEKQVLHM